jgi:Methyltransferase domain
VTPSPRPARPHGKFSLITCFEVIERTVSPPACLNDVAAFLVPGGCLVFSQPLQPADIEVLCGSWRNIGPRNDHCSFFTADARAWLAADSGLAFHRGDWPHSIAPADATETWPIPPWGHSA